MKQLVFEFGGDSLLGEKMISRLKAGRAEVIIRHFPDGETYVRILSDLKARHLIVVCSFNQPDSKLLPLLFLCKTARELGAARITLVAPYLGYMRQDKRFNPGEAVTSKYFAEIISSFVDELVTIDPHLHRRKSMDEIYSVHSTILHASDLISSYIKAQVPNPLLVGPDSESKQWVAGVAEKAGAPFIILKKKRLGDHKVEITVPHSEKFKDKTLVLIDDIISTARTMIETVNKLREAGSLPPVCIGVHGIFAGNSFDDLKHAGVSKIITCNTITHESNFIDVSELIVDAIISRV